MGYFTTFNLKIINNPTNINDSLIISLIEKSFELEDYSLTCNIPIKWYDWKEEMIIISSKLPKITFCLTGQGEDYGDMWRCYFKNGKYKHISFEDYKANELKELAL